MLTGSLVAMVTPFNADGSIDYGAFQALIEFQEAAGTDGLFFFGTAGEGSTLSDGERDLAIGRLMAMRRGSMPFHFGTTGAHTAHTIARTRVAREHGADGAVITVPPYLGPSEADAERYFLEVADASDLALAIYNNPFRLITDLHTPTLLRLFRHPNYRLYKEGTARSGQIAELLRAAPEVSIMAADSPDPDLMTPALALGGQGICSAVGNMLPAEMRALSRPWRSPEDVTRYRAEFLRLSPMFAFTYSARSPIAIKSLMNAVGLPAGQLRAPLRPLAPADIGRGVQLLETLGATTAGSLPNREGHYA